MNFKVYRHEPAVPFLSPARFPDFATPAQNIKTSVLFIKVLRNYFENYQNKDKLHIANILGTFWSPKEAFVTI